jgi:hypothetical protein
MTESIGPGGQPDPGAIPEPVSQLEPTTDVVPTAAVEVLPAAGAANAPIVSPGRRRLRWAIAAVATAVVIAGSALGFAVLSSAKSTSQVLPWAPSDALVYAEVRADLPGDQRANLLAFLSKFPGFADQTSFDAKADDGLNRLIRRMTDGKHDFSTEIKPWFGGQIGVSVEGTDPSSPGVLVVVSVRDTAAATTWLKSVAPADATHETVAGIDLTETAGASAKSSGAWAIDGSVILAGTVDAVKAAISRGPSGGLAGNAGFKAASAALGGDDLGNMYIDFKGYVSWLTTMEKNLMGGSAGSGVSSVPIPTLDAALLPGWTAMRIRAESDHLVLDEVLPTVAGQPAQANRTSALASSVPASALAQYELHDVGSLIQRTLTQLESYPGGPTAAQVDQVAKYVGGVDKAVGWIGDADIVVLHDGSSFSGGLVAQTKDATASANLLTELKNLVTLGSSQTGIRVRTEDYAGQTITIIEGDLGAIMPGGTAAMGSSPGTLQLAFTQTKDLVIAGVGEGFVKAVLDTKAGSSLADQPAYQRAINMAGSSNASQGYLDLTAIRTAIETFAAGSSDMKAYDSDVKPFLEPIQSIAWSQAAGADLSTARIVLVLK